MLSTLARFALCFGLLLGGVLPARAGGVVVVPIPEVCFEHLCAKVPTEWVASLQNSVFSATDGKTTFTIQITNAVDLTDIDTSTEPEFNISGNPFWAVAGNDTHSATYQGKVRYYKDEEEYSVVVITVNGDLETWRDRLIEWVVARNYDDLRQ